jgi:hypothetical protein
MKAGRPEHEKQRFRSIDGSDREIELNIRKEDKKYGLILDQGLPTERYYLFFECLGCGLVLNFNQDKMR